MAITVHVKGDLSSTRKFLKKCESFDPVTVLRKYGEAGVEALRNNTPVRTGKTAASWTYKIETSGNTVSLIWENTNLSRGQSIALLLRYGHGTRNGGYVRGYDYITPALRPIFNKIAEDAWQEVAR